MYAYVQICIIYSTDVCVCASVWILSVPPVSIKYIIESIEHDQHQPHQPQHHRLKNGLQIGAHVDLSHLKVIAFGGFGRCPVWLKSG